MNGLTDVHCHLLPYVDDGAENRDEALAMLAAQAEQGVSTVILTPHLRQGMFEMPSQTLSTQWKQLRAAAPAGSPTLYLGREHHCDKQFERLLEARQVDTLGGGPYLLMEFSGRHSGEEMQHLVQNAVSAGYRPIIAHAERYPALQNSDDMLAALTAAGAWIQINASSIIGQEGWTAKKLCRRWMKEDAVQLVASDAHHMDIRTPNLQLAAQYIEKKLGLAYAQKLLLDHPHTILDSMKLGEEGHEADLHQTEGTAL